MRKVICKLTWCVCKAGKVPILMDTAALEQVLDRPLFP